MEIQFYPTQLWPLTRARHKTTRVGEANTLRKYGRREQRSEQRETPVQSYNLFLSSSSRFFLSAAFKG